MKMELKRNIIICGDWIEAAKELPAGSVQCIITSPPYWGQRDYGVEGQLGLEKTFEEHIAKLVEGFREMRRILRDDGILWVNYGDKYATMKGKCYNPGGNETSIEAKKRDAGAIPLNRGNKSDFDGTGIKQGNLIGLAWRLALAMQADGWILRSDVVWAKAVSFNDKFSGSTRPEPLKGTRWERCRVKISPSKVYREGNKQKGYFPESCENRQAQWQDCPGCPKCEPHGGDVLRMGSWRCTRGHEFLLQFVKQIPYYADMEAVKEENATIPHSRGKGPCGLTADTITQHSGADAANREPDRIWNESGGRNLRDVWTPSKDPTDTQEEMGRLFEQFLQWLDMYGGNITDTWTINPQPSKGAHYATFPEKLVEPCIKVSTSGKGCCPECGAPWARIIDSKRTFQSGSGKSGNIPSGKHGPNLQGGGETLDVRRGPCVETTTLGWRPTCACPGLDGDSPGSVCAEDSNWPTVPCIVYDPFAGSGTVAAVAARLGRDYRGTEINADYLEKQARPRIHKAETGLGHHEIRQGQKALPFQANEQSKI